MTARPRLRCDCGRPLVQGVVCSYCARGPDWCVCSPTARAWSDLAGRYVVLNDDDPGGACKALDPTLPFEPDGDPDEYPGRHAPVPASYFENVADYRASRTDRWRREDRDRRERLKRGRADEVAMKWPRACVHGA